MLGEATAKNRGGFPIAFAITGMGDRSYPDKYNFSPLTVVSAARHESWLKPGYEFSKNLTNKIEVAGRLAGGLTYGMPFSSHPSCVAWQ